VSDIRRGSSPRPLFKSLIDGLVFMAALAIVVIALQRTGLLAPDHGVYTAIDGDSLRNGDSDIRLYGIDAPELHQHCRDAHGRDYPCGHEARRALADLVADRELSCVVEDTDRYGRSVAQCAAGDIDINAEMVRQGWAIAFRRHSLDYVSFEAAARREKLGLWRGSFEDPSAWRDAHRVELTRGDLGE
jgi:endonuclease YncB( thermonuclease family)